MRWALLAAAAAALLLAVPAGRAAGECDGFMSCIPVAGPWVAIPPASASAPFPAARWQLKCPQGIVGGLDARLSDRAIDIGFPGLIGSPVNPGITTRDSVVFEGTYTGTARRWTSFRPFIGCIPAAGGRRTPVQFSPVQEFPPGSPTVLRVRTLRLAPGRLLRATHGCAPGERLISASHAVGFHTSRPPVAALLARVHVVQNERDARILVSASRRGLPGSIRVDVQVQALCVRRSPAP